MFIETVCKRLKFGNRCEVMDLISRKGGLMVAWTISVKVKQIYTSNFCIELLVTMAEK